MGNLTIIGLDTHQVLHHPYYITIYDYSSGFTSFINYNNSKVYSLGFTSSLYDNS